MSAPPIRATGSWLPHKFPIKRVTRRVVTARRPYTCETIGTPPEGHVRRIEAGASYLKVGIRPEAGSSAGWRTRRFCRSCALFFELAKRADP